MTDDETNNQTPDLVLELKRLEQSVKDLEYQVKFLYIVIVSFIVIVIFMSIN